MNEDTEWSEEIVTAFESTEKSLAEASIARENAWAELQDAAFNTFS